MTFSIVARCSRSGQFAVAVSSSSPAVAARCAFARAGVGAVTTQNVTDPRLGPWALDLMEAGASAAEARDIIVRNCTFPSYRQMSLIDREGRTALWSGEKSLGTNADFQGINAASAGNLLASADVPEAIVRSFEQSDPDMELGLRVVKAMQAGVQAGGEAGPIRSAGLLVVDREAWPLADLRVDEEADPVTRLHGLWSVWEPQMHDYVTRCLNPTDAPSYGVPGDE
ncbi:DUF1028 domain-containing protein [Acetobacter conturbans]|uniref:DUF1028 domain-containing protein n=1 Tax=Acetobacter conturbans TaxID=1737472 RepID=A0ABX0JWU8_9PROT|nr:DUF1028 domain-containing protein [Acetobacter conturbans]NHN87238.1 DUF1028 domain-containing protein [Acetobacter conturbans]